MNSASSEFRVIRLLGLSVLSYKVHGHVTSD